MRRSVGLLVTSGLLPIIALSGAFGFVTLRSQRATVQTGIETAARFSAALASTRLVDGMRAIDMVAQSPAFDGALDVPRFATLAARIRGAQSAWSFLSVADPQGRRLLDLPSPISGVRGGQVVDPDSLARAVATRKPIVGDVVVGPRGGSAFAVRAPVVRDGRVDYVVSAVVQARMLEPVLRFRPLPRGWRAVIVDGRGNLVAANDASSGKVAKRVSEQGLRQRQTGRPGLYEYQRSDGTWAVAAWAPIAGTEWSAHVSAPRADYAGATSSALVLLVGVALACLGLLAILIRLLIAEIRQDRARATAEIQRQRMEALGQLTGGVAHDFNNLLTPILGGLDLIRTRAGGDEKVARYVDAAMGSAERARALVARLLAFSRRQTLSSSLFDIGDLLEGLRDLLARSLGPGARVELVAPAAPLPVFADRTQLELALLNLAINARDAMPDGGVVRLTAEPLDIAQAEDIAPGAYVAISVVDTGTGMDADTLHSAIDPFFTTKAAGKGTGLGLSMVHGFAAQSGGVLRLDSQAGAGTTATIILPRAADAAANPAPVTPASLPPASGDILLVDDDDDARTAIAEMLAEAGYGVTQAVSAADALDRIAAAGEWDLIVTDYAMPGGSGADLIRRLRDDGLATPILLITGYADAARDIPDAIPRLAKPFRTAELLEAVARLRSA